ncbi:hypothetical protein ABZW51_33025, partial [Streptomyces cellulosae]
MSAGVRTLVSPAVLARPRGKAVYWTVFTGVVLLFTLAFLFPVYWMVTGAMKSPDEVGTHGSWATPGDDQPDSSRSGLPSLLVYLGIGIAIGQDGIGDIQFDN